MNENRQKKLKGRLSLLQSILTILFISSCIFPDFVSAKVIKVGVYENAPKVFTAKSGKPAGIFIDIIEEIAEKENWELKFINGSWAGSSIGRRNRSHAGRCLYSGSREYIRFPQNTGFIFMVSGLCPQTKQC